MIKELAATKEELDAISKIAEDYEDVGHPNEKLYRTMIVVKSS